ncbi:chaplin [Streptomyces sp. SID8352]|uniref:chaplin n=1 Tax=Streptomyces sp. SID8352 TaxID=2690338 RepID=UPI00139CFBD6|nr:chaplin [Streptomyces sp. SID8352]MYU24816.1 DUF320 domain-containing protein [Streptomyces sp. SID8352]
MRRVTRNGVLAVAASGAMAVTLPAYAAFAAGGASADGAAVGSPGVISGNTVQLPVDVPVNVCGNTVNVVGLLNPAAGNKCANTGGSEAGPGEQHGSGGYGEESGSHGGASSGTSGGATAEGAAVGSPGVISGNGVQLPVDVPVNVTGNSVNVVGVGNPVFGNQSVNTPGDRPEPPERPTEPTPEPSPEPPAPARPHIPAKPAPEPAAPPSAGPGTEASLAHTGADGTMTALAGSTALALGGAALYRRFRPGREA